MVQRGVICSDPTREGHRSARCGLLRQRVKQQSPGGLGGAAAGGGTRVRDYLRMFVVTLLMVGFSGGITGAFPALDKVCPPPPSASPNSTCLLFTPGAAASCCRRRY